MKKFFVRALALFLSATLLLSLAACGKERNETPWRSPSSQADVTASVSETSEEDAEFDQRLVGGWTMVSKTDNGLPMDFDDLYFLPDGGFKCDSLYVTVSPTLFEIEGIEGESPKVKTKNNSFNLWEIATEYWKIMHEQGAELDLDSNYLKEIEENNEMGQNWYVDLSVTYEFEDISEATGEYNKNCNHLYEANGDDKLILHCTGFAGETKETAQEIDTTVTFEKNYMVLTEPVYFFIALHGTEWEDQDGNRWRFFDDYSETNELDVFPLTVSCDGQEVLAEVEPDSFSMAQEEGFASFPGLRFKFPDVSQVDENSSKIVQDVWVLSNCSNHLVIPQYTGSQMVLEGKNTEQLLETELDRTARFILNRVDSAGEQAPAPKPDPTAKPTVVPTATPAPKTEWELLSERDVKLVNDWGAQIWFVQGRYLYYLDHPEQDGWYTYNPRKLFVVDLMTGTEKPVDEGDIGPPQYAQGYLYYKIMHYATDSFDASIQYKRVALGGSEPEVLEKIVDQAAQLCSLDSNQVCFDDWDNMGNEYYVDRSPRLANDTSDRTSYRKTPEGRVSSAEVSGTPFNGKLYAPLNDDEDYGIMVYDFDTGERTTIEGVKSGSIYDISDDLIVMSLGGQSISLGGESMRESTYVVYRFSDGATQEFTAVPPGGVKICGNYVYHLSAGNNCILYRINVETGELEDLTEIGCRNFMIDEKNQVLYYQSFYDPRKVYRILLRGDSWTRIDEAPEIPGPDDVWGYYHTNGEQEPVMSLALYQDGTFFLLYRSPYYFALSGTYKEKQGTVRLSPSLFNGEDSVLDEMGEILFTTDYENGEISLVDGVNLREDQNDTFSTRIPDGMTITKFF